MADGYAVVVDGKVLIRTVSDTSRAAMVNWLVTERKVMVFDDTVDGMIAAAFNRFRAEAQPQHDIQVKRVSVLVLS